MGPTKKISILGVIAVLGISSSAFAGCFPGNVLQFDGVDDYMNCGDIDEVDGTTNLTITAWINTNSISVQKLISRKGEDYPPYFFWVMSDYTILFGVYSPIPYRANTTEAISPYQWFFVAGTYDGETVRTYINGVEKAVNTDPSGPANSNGFSVTIGAGYPEYSTAWFNGKIDEFRIYNRALSAEEIQQLYCYGYSPDTNLVAYWDFDEGQGQVVHDMSGNLNHGYLGSNPNDTDPYDPTWVESDIPPTGIYYVDDDADNDPNWLDPTQSDPNENGTCSHPFDSIQKAIQQAITNAGICYPIIIVRDGIYTGIGNYDIDTQGLAVTIKSENGPTNCIIDCQDNGRAFLFQTGEDATTIIDGFTITDGNSIRNGGAIYCHASSPTIKNCVITGSYAAWSGGAIWLQQGSNALITHCIITYNYADVAAGAICNYDSSPTIKNCIISRNSGYWSGALTSTLSSSYPEISNCTIADNSAENGPGAIESFLAGNFMVTNSILWNNIGTSDEQIFEEDGIVTATYSDIQMADPNSHWPGIGNINAAPLFVAPELPDYHLKSTAGRWRQLTYINGDFNNDGVVNCLDLEIFVRYWLKTGPAMPADLNPDNSVDLADFAILATNWRAQIEDVGEWILDDVSSPCIDAGNPGYDYSLEPLPNGEIINMGAYGDTEQSSKSPN